MAQSKVYERDIPEGHPQILIVGDSTAVGTGVTDPALSVAGRFGNDFPNASITNLAKNGAKIHDVVMTLRSLPQGRVYDLVVIQVGANDVIFFSKLKEQPIEQMLELAKKVSSHVVWLTAGNIGLAPIFPWPISLIMTDRTRDLRELALSRTRLQKVIYVDLFEEKGEDPFVKDVERYYAPDREHLSADGYGYWYDRIRDELVKERVVIQ